MNFKTRILNKLRTFGKLLPVERVLVGLALNKTVGSFFAKAAANNYQYPKNNIRTCERGGIRYSLDISDYMQYCIYFGIEIEPRERLYGLVQNGTTVIDVGTNIGETLLNFAKINTEGRNIGFEPVPHLYEIAKRNIALNEFKNIELVNKGLSSTYEVLSFHDVSENNSGGTFLTRENNSDANRSVEAVRLDEFVKRNGIDNISLIKIDVEGFEMEVLKGASATLHSFKPVLFVEIDNALLARQKTSDAEIFRFLENHDYTIEHARTGEKLDPGHAAKDEHFDIVASPAS